MGMFDDLIPGFARRALQILIRDRSADGRADRRSAEAFGRVMNRIQAGAQLVNMPVAAGLAYQAALAAETVTLGLLADDEDTWDRLEQARGRLASLLRNPAEQNDSGMAAALERFIRQHAAPKAVADLTTSAALTPPGSGGEVTTDVFTLGDRLGGETAYLVVLDPVRHQSHGVGPLELLEEIAALGRIFKVGQREVPGGLRMDVLAATALPEENLRVALEPEAVRIFIPGPEDIAVGNDVASHEEPPGLPLSAPPPDFKPGNRFGQKGKAKPEPPRNSYTLPKTSAPPPPGSQLKVKPEPEPEPEPSPEPMRELPPEPVREAEVPAASVAAEEKAPAPRPEEEPEEHPAERTEEDPEFLTFQLGRTEYGLPTINIREIISVPPVTRLPGAPEAVMGVINLRGMIVPVVNLRTMMGLEARQFDKYTVIIVVEMDGRLTGLTADYVSEVITLEEDAIQSSPEFTSRSSARFVSGLGRLGDRFVILLDIQSLLSDSGIKPSDWPT